MANMQFVCFQNDLRYLWGAPDKVLAYASEAVGPRMVFERVPAGDGLVAYRGLEGKFWTAENGLIRLSSAELSGATRFKEIWFGDDRVAMLAENGKFVGVPRTVFEGFAELRIDEADDNEKFWFEQPPIGLAPENTGTKAEKLVPEIRPKITDSAELESDGAIRLNTARITDAVQGSDSISGASTTRRLQ